MLSVNFVSSLSAFVIKGFKTVITKAQNEDTKNTEFELTASRCDFLLFAINICKGRHAARGVAAFCLGEIVLQHDENLPLVAVRIVDPSLIL